MRRKSHIQKMLWCKQSTVISISVTPSKYFIQKILWHLPHQLTNDINLSLTAQKPERTSGAGTRRSWRPLLTQAILWHGSQRPWKDTAIHGQVITTQLLCSLHHRHVEYLISCTLSWCSEDKHLLKMTQHRLAGERCSDIPVMTGI